MKPLLSLLSAFFVFLTVTGGLHAQTEGPLFFNPGHVRETLTKPEVKPYWDQVLQTAERVNTPGDSLYLDPEKMGVVPLDHKGFQLAGRANHVCRVVDGSARGRDWLAEGGIESRQRRKRVILYLTTYSYAV